MKGIKNPKICFFGDRNKILIYEMEKDKWKIFFTKSTELEFNYYSAAVSLPNGDAILTGGGDSCACYYFHFDTLTLEEKSPMHQCRKEHVSIMLRNKIYSIGGYDANKNTFLSSCERYSLEKDKWELIADFKLAKCAFAACAIQDRFIYTFGGYDGNERLDMIEQYDVENGEWNIFNIQLTNPLSNCACFALDDNNIILLGGGHSEGFSLAVKMVNLQDKQIIDLKNMPGGKDLRNKIVVVNGEAYTFGGNMLLGEKYNILKNQWITLSSYNELLEDNLDSWACAYTFDIPGYRESQFTEDNENINYQMYEDEEAGIFGHNYFDHELGVLENVRNLQDLENEGDHLYMDDVYYGNDYLEDAYEEDDGYY